MENTSPSFLVRNEFLIRRLHSLSGLIPVGAFMCVHLAVNASVLNSPSTFQNNVYNIHRLGSLLPLVEWAFIFLPILFHAVFGVVIIAGGLPNTGSYPYAANYRYTLQRATGIIAFIFIMLHVFHMHGWFHADAWLESIKVWGGAQFSPFNATSTGGEALQGVVIFTLYAIGVLACVYHLANGIWTMGITWGVWTSAKGQARASAVCSLFGVAIALVGLSGLFGMRAATADKTDLEQIRADENRMYEHKVDAKEIEPDEHKRWHPPEGEHGEVAEAR